MNAVIVSEITINEQLDSDYIDEETNPVVKFDGLNSQHVLDGEDITKQATGAFRLSGGSLVLDLTSIPGLNGGPQNGTNMRVKAIKFRNLKTNDDPISVRANESSGYQLAGLDFKMTLLPGQHFLLYLGDDGSVINSSNRALLLEGTGTEVMEISVVMG